MYVRSLRRAGYDVDWVCHWHRRLCGGNKAPYDLLLLDIMLPEAGGRRTGSVRHDTTDKIPNTRVIILT